MVGGIIKKKKPKFFRVGWYKRIKLGSQTKKKRKWRSSRGRDSKTRLKENGRPKMPSIGYGADRKARGFIKGLEPIRVCSLKDLENVKKNQGIIIASLGKRKKQEIISKANEQKITILNRYKGKNATA